MNVLIIGGAGFIGCNLAEYFAAKADVTILDNLSRSGASENLRWLRNRYPQICFHHTDIRNTHDLSVVEVQEAFEKADAIYHLAGQVAVTKSVTDPVGDFTANALGTLNVVEAIRAFSRDQGRHPTVIFSSTNKVYGSLEHVRVRREGPHCTDRPGKYEFIDYPKGISEDMPLHFHSPYGCTKGYADQYIRDISRPDIFDMKTVVFRQSCIYGPRQFGVEDQGWVAWFTIASVCGLPLTIYGDGMQTRDILFVTDLCRAFDLATQNITNARGRIFNIGGGGGNAVSLLGLVGQLDSLSQRPLAVRKADWRPGDQRCFVCDTTAAEECFGWLPEVGVADGIARLHGWVKEMNATNPGLFQRVRG